MSEKKITLDLKEYESLLKENKRLENDNSELVKGATVVYYPKILVGEKYEPIHSWDGIPTGRFNHTGYTIKSVGCENQEEYSETFERLICDISQYIYDLPLSKDLLDFNVDKIKLEKEMQRKVEEFNKWKWDEKRNIEKLKDKQKNSFKVRWRSFLIGVIASSLFFYMYGG